MPASRNARLQLEKLGKSSPRLQVQVQVRPPAIKGRDSGGKEWTRVEGGTNNRQGRNFHELSLNNDGSDDVKR